MGVPWRRPGPVTASKAANGPTVRTTSGWNAGGDVGDGPGRGPPGMGPAGQVDPGDAALVDHGSQRAGAGGQQHVVAGSLEGGGQVDGGVLRPADAQVVQVEQQPHSACQAA